MEDCGPIVDEHELRAGDGCGSGTTAARINRSGLPDVDDECWNVDLFQPATFDRLRRRCDTLPPDGDLVVVAIPGKTSAFGDRGRSAG